MTYTIRWARYGVMGLLGAMALGACGAPPCPQPPAAGSAATAATQPGPAESAHASDGNRGADPAATQAHAASGQGAADASTATYPEKRGTLRDRHGTLLTGRKAKPIPASLTPWLGALDDSGHGASGLHKRFDAKLAAGEDVTVSLDPQWHRRLEQVFARVERGAGVIIDLRGGKVRALFSTLPHNDDAGLASRHLATARPANAGSTFKPFTTIAALAAGAMRPDTTHECKGTLKVGMRRFRCWGTHGRMDAAKALAMSDNIFFWHLALKMKHDNIADTQHAFGLGEPSTLLPAASAGFIPRQRYFEMDGRSMQTGFTLNQSIGHGHVLITPLQLARAYAALATGALPELSLSETAPPRSTPLDTSWAPHLALVRKALRGTITEPHGSAHFAGPVPDVAGKTGTAIRLEPGADRIPNAGRQLGWFAGWAPAEQPQIAFAFVAEDHSGPETAKRVLQAVRALP